MQETLRTYKANIFRALSHPTRIAILEVLRDRELSARTIQEKLGLEQANLSQHLAILRSHQIVVNRKEGNQVFYSIRNPVLVRGSRHHAPVLPSQPRRRRSDARGSGM